MAKPFSFNEAKGHTAHYFLMQPIRRRTASTFCTVPVVARLSSAVGWQQTWAPPFGQYEWVTLAGAVVAAGLLIFGLLQVTQPTLKEDVLRSESTQVQKHTPSDARSRTSE